MRRRPAPADRPPGKSPGVGSRPRLARSRTRRRPVSLPATVARPTGASSRPLSPSSSSGPSSSLRSSSRPTTPRSFVTTGPPATLDREDARAGVVALRSEISARAPFQRRLVDGAGAWPDGRHELRPLLAQLAVDAVLEGVPGALVECVEARGQHRHADSGDDDRQPEAQPAEAPNHRSRAGGSRRRAQSRSARPIRCSATCCAGS